MNAGYKLVYEGFYNCRKKDVLEQSFVRKFLNPEIDTLEVNEI